MTRRALTLIALTLLPLAACATVPDAPIVDGGRVRTDGLARLDEPTQVGKLVLTPKALLEDSRCPINARCVWAGRAIVRVRIDGAGWRDTIDLTLGEPQAVHATSVTLTSVEPGRTTDTAPKSGDYVFGFEGG